MVFARKPMLKPSSMSAGSWTRWVRRSRLLVREIEPDDPRVTRTYILKRGVRETRQYPARAWRLIGAKICRILDRPERPLNFHFVYASLIGTRPPVLLKSSYVATNDLMVHTHPLHHHAKPARRSFLRSEYHKKPSRPRQTQSHPSGAVVPFFRSLSSCRRRSPSDDPLVLPCQSMLFARVVNVFLFEYGQCRTRLIRPEKRSADAELSAQI